MMTKIRKAGVYFTTIIITIWFVTQTLYPASQALTHGFGAYYSAARLLQMGQFSAQVYDPAYFRPIVRTDSHRQADDIYHANPPTTSLMLWPLSFVSIENARLIWTLSNALLLFGGLALLLFAFSPRPTLPMAALLASLGMLFQPALENIRLGQAYLLIFGLLALAVVAWSKWGKTAPLGGAALALALVLKTAGWALLPVLFWQRQWRRLWWAVGVVGVILIMTLPLFPPPLWQRYGQLLNETSRSAATCAAAYQTTRSLLCRLFVFDSVWNQTPLANLPWLASILLISLALLTLGFILTLARRNETLALIAALAWGVIFAPLGEQYHHTVMLIPLSWLILRWDRLNWFSQGCLIAAVFLYISPLPGSNENGLLLAYPRLYGAWLTLAALFPRLEIRDSSNLQS
ncbi:MAG: DUF2029 domain-containing protein [Anaerolineales bacterium]|nr:DUF2029 domain-containing protein [Anaerolineales bacterium]